MCHQCKTKPVYEFINKRKVCKTCFIHWFEKKVLYTIRKFNMLNRGDIVRYKKSNDFRSVVLEEVLKILASKGRIEITNAKKYNKLATFLTTDLVAYEIVNEIINGDVRDLKKLNPVDRKVIKPLYLFLDKEVLLYAELKGLKFKKITDLISPLPSPALPPRGRKDKIKFANYQKISKFINNLEKKHPEIKWSIVRGWLKIN